MSHLPTKQGATGSWGGPLSALPSCWQQWFLPKFFSYLRSSLCPSLPHLFSPALSTLNSFFFSEYSESNKSEYVAFFLKAFHSFPDYWRIKCNLLAWTGLKPLCLLPSFPIPIQSNSLPNGPFEKHLSCIFNLAPVTPWAQTSSFLWRILFSLSKNF